MYDASSVAMARTAKTGYPPAPCDPSERFPELPPAACGRASNEVYGAVRRALAALGLDGGNAGTPSWNPLGEVVHPGDTVLVKPNFVCGRRESRPGEWRQIVTDSAVLRPVLDYAAIALQGRGRILLADSPQGDSDFGLLAERTGVREMCRRVSSLAGISVEIIDLRRETLTVHRGVVTGTRPLSGDPAGYRMCRLTNGSHFDGAPGTARFYGASYDASETNSAHAGDAHSYEVSATALAADVILSVPKLKTHKKCGMTGALKGLVGLTGNKNLLPHYRFGAPPDGGDQFPPTRGAGSIENWFVGAGKAALRRCGPLASLPAGILKPIAYMIFGRTDKVVRSGNWPGNDTIWRTVLDLAAILTLADREGVIRDVPQRRFFCVCDGIVAGEGNGPLDAEAVDAGLVIAGGSPLCVDAVCASICGFDPMLLPIVRGGFGSALLPPPCGPGDIATLIEPSPEPVRGLDGLPVIAALRPHFAWTGATRR